MTIYNLKNNSFFIIFIIVFFYFSAVSAAPPTSKYTPGETLAPTCAPSDTNCTVTAPATSGVNSDITSLSGLTTAVSVSQGGTGFSTITALKLLYTTAIDTLSEISLSSVFEVVGGVLGLADGTITEAKLDILNAPTDGDFLTWDNTSSKPEWNSGSSYLPLSGGTITGNIIPDVDGSHSLGTTTNRFGDVWTDELHVGANSLYVNDKKVISDVSDTMNFTTDLNQNMIMKTSGIGSLTQQASGTGNLVLTSNSGNINVLSTSGNLNLGTTGTGQLNLGAVDSGIWQGTAIADGYISSGANWNTAYGWGDHSLQGYVSTSDDTVSGTELDGIFSTTGILTRIGVGTYSTTTDNSTNWDSAFGWGDHSGQGYLTSYTETDPSLNITTPINGQLLQYNSTGGKWENFTSSYLTSESDPALATWAGSANITTLGTVTSGDVDAIVTSSSVGLGSVENTALSTWAGTTNITTVGALTSTSIGGITEANLVDKSATEAITGAWDFGGGGVEVPNSISLPGTCTVGQIYMDTDATSGQRVYACESTNTWAVQGDGGGSGDITAVGSMTSGVAFGDATATGDWLGLGSGAGRIEFDDQATDEVNILGANVGIGTTAPGSKLDVYNSGTVSTIVRVRNDTTTVYLDANNGYSYLNTFTNDPMLFGTNNAERMRITNIGNVGIGTTNPQAKLQIDSVDPNDVIRMRNIDTSDYYAWRFDSSGNLIVDFWDNSAGANYYPFKILNDARTNALVIQGSNVGIGTTGPDAKLEVNGGGADVFTHLTAGVGEFDSRLALTESANFGMYLEYDGVANIGYLGMGNNVAPTGSWSKRIQMSRTGTEVAFMAGNVGIGTTSPQSNLHVSGTGSGNDIRLGNTSGHIILYNNNDDGLWTMSDDATHVQLILATGYNFDNSIEFDYAPGTLGASGGVLKIGQLSDQGGGGWTHGITSLYTAGAERLRIDATGNIGIGTTSPSELLHISNDGSTGIRLSRAETSGSSSYIDQYKARGTHSSPSAVVDNDFISLDRAYGYQNSAYQLAGYYGFRVDGTPSGNNIPTEYLIATNNGSSTATRFTVSGAGNVGFNTATFDGTAAGVLAIANATAPVAGTANQSYIYAKDVSASSEMFVMDEAGNETQISPHDLETGEWIYFSKNINTGRVVRIDMERLVKKFEEITGETFITETWE